MRQARLLGCRDLGRRLRFGGALLEIGELQLELLDELCPALGGLAELLAARLGEQQLEALDLQPEGGDLVGLAGDRGVPLGEPRLGIEPCGALGRIIACAAARSSGSGSGLFTKKIQAHSRWLVGPDRLIRVTVPQFDPAWSGAPERPGSARRTGLQVCCGIRQSMPSSR